MKKMKKLVVMLLTLTMIMSMFSVASAGVITNANGYEGQSWLDGKYVCMASDGLNSSNYTTAVGWEVIINPAVATNGKINVQSGWSGNADASKSFGPAGWGADIDWTDNGDGTYTVKYVGESALFAGVDGGNFLYVDCWGDSTVEIAIEAVYFLNADGERIVSEKTLAASSFSNSGIADEMSVGDTFTVSIDRTDMNLENNLVNLKIKADSDEGTAWKNIYLESGSATLDAAELESVGLSATVSTVGDVTTFTFKCEKDTASCGYSLLTIKAEFCTDGSVKDAYSFTNTIYLYPDIPSFTVIAAEELEPNVTYKQTADNNVRFVQLISEEYAKNCSEVNYTVSYNGAVKATLTSNECYSAVSVAGETLTAPEGYVFVACVVTNVPDVSLVTCEISFTEIEQ